MKTCIACGMPMEKPELHASGDVDKDWCIHCARQDGSMRSYDECLVGMTGFIVKSQGLDEGAAREMAKTMMAQLPAWKDPKPS
jgi:hypothetical protein